MSFSGGVTTPPYIGEERKEHELKYGKHKQLSAEG